MRSLLLLSILALSAPTTWLRAAGQPEGDAGSARDQHIANGQEPAPDAYPWMVALLHASERDDPWLAQICGGVLIHPRWVLTAAHCIDGLYPSDIEVWVGSGRLENGQGRRVRASEIRPYPFYDGATLDGDLALVLLEEAVEGVSPLSLVATDAETVAGTIARAVGWGLEGSGPAPVSLREVDLPLVPSSEVEPFFDLVTDQMLFAGSATEGIGICSGDSGGPLLIATGGGQWALAGLSSFGRTDLNCDEPGSYSGFTRLSRFRDWIDASVAPTRARWESRHGVPADLSDTDADGVPNWLEFAFGTAPDVAEPSLPVRLERGDGRLWLHYTSAGDEVAYHLWSSSDGLRTWQDGGDVSADSIIVGDTEAAQGLSYQRRVVELALPPAGESRFLRLWPAVSAAMVPADELIGLPGYLYSGMDAMQRSDPASGPLFRRFQIDLGAEPPAAVHVTLRGRGNARMHGLKIVLDDGKEVPGAVPEAIAGGWRVRFQPVAGVTHHVEVAVERGEAAPDFRLAVFTPPAVAGAIAAGGTRNGTLSTSDPVDPQWPEKIYYADDYAVTPPTGNRHLVARMISSGEKPDPVLELIDGETGQLLALNDDINNSSLNSYLNFVAPPDRRPLLLRATSAGEAQAGNYTLSLGEGPILRRGSAAVSGELSTSDPVDPNFEEIYYRDDYLLTQVGTTGSIRISLKPAANLDGYLYLLDAHTGAILQEADIGLEGQAEVIEHPIRDGQEYLVRVSSYEAFETGSYTLRAE